MSKILLMVTIITIAIYIEFPKQNSIQNQSFIKVLEKTRKEKIAWLAMDI